MSDEVPLREFLEARDNQLSDRLDKFEKDNAQDHAKVMGEFSEFRTEVRAELSEIKREINGKMAGVVTWRSLGFALTLALALYALADRL